MCKLTESFFIWYPRIRIKLRFISNLSKNFFSSLSELVPSMVSNNTDKAVLGGRSSMRAPKRSKNAAQLGFSFSPVAVVWLSSTCVNVFQMKRMSSVEFAAEKQKSLEVRNWIGSALSLPKVQVKKRTTSTQQWAPSPIHPLVLDHFVEDMILGSYWWVQQCNNTQY